MSQIVLEWAIIRSLSHVGDVTSWRHVGIWLQRYEAAMGCNFDRGSARKHRPVSGCGRARAPAHGATGCPRASMQYMASVGTGYGLVRGIGRIQTVSAHASVDPLLPVAIPKTRHSGCEERTS